jgi:hypothetical protein|tara:strand:- start:380 stop:682 length:303 start_codon:yes stop_codon:yes gene_type:complete
MKKFLKVPVYNSGGTFVRNDQVKLSGVIGCYIDRGSVRFDYEESASVKLANDAVTATYTAADVAVAQGVIKDAMGSKWTEVLFDLPSLPGGNVEVVTVTA